MSTIQSSNGSSNLPSEDYINNLCNELYVKYSVPADEIKQLIMTLGFSKAANELGYNITDHNYSKVAGRLIVENNRHTAPKDFKKAMNIMRKSKVGMKNRIWQFIKWNSKKINKEIKAWKHIDDDFYDFFSGSMMCNFFCKKIKDQIIETPAYVFMRCAVQAFHRQGLKKVLKCFQVYITGKATPPTPYMNNACTLKPQLASCFLMNVDDTMESILETAAFDAGMISSEVGGVGLGLTRVRNNVIRDGGVSQGVIPICVLINDTMKLCNQGSIRKGACTATLAVWHYDIEEFIQVVRKGGDRYSTAPDINNAVWMNRLFYERAVKGQSWTLFCPSVVPDLIDLYGDAFRKRYIEYENDLSITRKKVVDARHINDLIAEMKVETGMPYVMNGDSINEKSNQKHRGTIDLTNLCTEIVEYARPGLPAVCNLHSLNLYAHYKKVYTGDFLESYDFKGLGDSAAFTLEILNTVFKETYYPLDVIDKKTGKTLKKGKINKANKIDRPVGLGVAGFSDVVQDMELEMESEETKRLNKMMASCVYFNAWCKSVDLAIKHGRYSTFEGSPTSEGILQFDMWMKSYKDRVEKEGPNPFVNETDLLPVEPFEWKQEPYKLSNGDVIQPVYDDLKRALMKYGSYNCMITSNMPTATSASSRGVCETTEAPQSNFYSRKLTAGAFPMINKYLQNKLKAIDLWDADVVNYLKENRGSMKDYHKYLEILKDENEKKRNESDNSDVNEVEGMNTNEDVGNITNEKLERVKQLEGIFKTSFELRPTKMVDLNADRAIYCDQSISMNHYINEPTKDKLVKLDMYCQFKDMKTNNYYVRQMSNDICAFTADLTMKDKIKETKLKSMTTGFCRVVNGKASCCDS